jgi:GNAT superfamily N-acetyltransferase
MPSIRRAQLTDLEELLQLVAEFYVADRHEYSRDLVVPALVPLLADDALGQVWVLADDDQLTGYAMVTWTWSLESGGRDCILDEIYVRDPGEGWGGLLLDHAIAEATAFGARAAFLETEAPNVRARRFYERHGFQIEDSIWMSVRLSPES